MQAKMLCVRLCMWIPVRIVRLCGAELVASQRQGGKRRGATGTARTRGLPRRARHSLSLFSAAASWGSTPGCGMRGEAREDEQAYPLSPVAEGRAHPQAVSALGR